MEGIYLGSCKTMANMVECTTGSDTENMGGSGFRLEQMGGVVILTESGVFFGTEWDDELIRPENFREFNLDETHTDIAVPSKDVAVGGTVEENKEELGEEAAENFVDEMHEPILAEDKGDGEETAETEAGDIEKEEEKEEEVPGPSEMLAGQEMLFSRDRREEEKGKHARDEEGCIFEEGDIIKCWKIQPQDLAHFDRRDWGLRNNRFLLYGYYNFGHLLLCRKADGTYLLGIPGGYDQQERFMANMFGFPCFKESRSIRLRKGKGGYWYRSVNPPDFNRWDRFQKDSAEML